MDHGIEGLKSTIYTCMENGIGYVGAGRNAEEARKPYILAIGGRTIAVVNVAENEFGMASERRGGANPVDPVANFYDIRLAKAKAHVVIVVAHGGREMFEHPLPSVQDRYRFYIEAGADAVIGHHPHCIQGYELYRGAPIFYSLGNFVFPSTRNRNHSWYVGYAVRLFISEALDDFELLPFVQGKEEYGIRTMTSVERYEFERELAAKNDVINNRTLLYNKFQEHSSAHTSEYLGMLQPYRSKYLRQLFAMRVLPTMLSRSQYRLFLNLIRCETHREMLIEILDIASSTTRLPS